MRVPFGEWAPDLYQLVGGDKLRVAKNVLPKVGGYEPYPSLQNLTTEVLPFAPRGAFRAQRSTGTNVFFAAVEDTVTGLMELYQFRSSGGTNQWVDVSSTTETYGSVRNKRVEFAQFDEIVFAMSYTSDTQALDFSGATEFSRISTTCPRASHGIVNNGFLILGRLFTNDAGAISDGIAWSAFGAPLSWPTPGTDEATALLSGRVSLRNGGGPVNGIVSGSEVVAVFQENAIVRMDFIGNDAVWAFNDVVTDHGLRIPGAAVAIERGVFYVGTDGFRIFDYTSSRPIGKGRIDDWFTENYDEDYPDSVSIVRDPKRTQVRMTFAAPGNSGVPNRTLIYDWALDRFAYSDTGAYSLVGAGASPASLDSPDIAGDQNTLQGNTGGGFDTDYDQLSFDDRQSGTFSQTIGGFDSSFRLGTYEGTNLSGELETGMMEPQPGRRAVVSGIRSHVRSPSVTVQIAGVGDDDLELPANIEFGYPKERLRNGIHPAEIDTRYLVARFNLGTNWQEAAFFDVESTPGGEI